jgi:hypothetical protein
MANMDEFGGIMDNQDWEAQDRIREEVKHSQQLRVKDNIIKDLETSNMFLNKQVDTLLEENHGLRRALEEAQVSSITYNPAPGQIGAGSFFEKNPDLLIKLQELRNCGEQLQQDLERLRESFKRG